MVAIDGTESIPNELGYLQVYVLSIVPSIVLPSAPGVISYRFEIIGEGVQESDIEIREIVIGPVSCSSFITFPEQEKRLDCTVQAPALWTNDTAYYRLATAGGRLAETQKRSFLRPQPAPEVLAVNTATDNDMPRKEGVEPSTEGRVPTTGGLFAIIAGLGFGTKDRQPGEIGPDRQYDGDVEYVDFGAGQDATRVYHNRMVFADGRVEYWLPVQSNRLLPT